MSTRKEQLGLSILKSIQLAGARMMREDILFRTVAMELAHLQLAPTEIKRGITDLETAGKIASERDDYGVVRFVLTDAGRGELLSKGM